MGIKCSLFGHAFGDSEVEREREEQGSEVVITIREMETCTRCGEERVVSENKEVTTLETPDDVEAPPVDQDAPADPAEDGPDPDPVIDEAESAVEDDAESDPADGLETDLDDEPVVEAEDAATEETPPVTDDAEILEDEDEDEPAREPGQWPQEADPADEMDASEPTPDGDAFDQLGYDDDPIDEDATDAEIIDDEPAEAAADSEADDTLEEADTDDPQPAQTNEWPSEAEIDAASEPESAGPGAVTVPEGSFVCEGCGFTTPVESSSLREGDFCPECHQETLIQVRDRT